MANQNKKSIFFILGLILLLAGCSKRDNKIISNLNSRPNDFEQTKDNVKIEAKFLSNKEFNVLFKSPSLWIRQSSSKNYQAILLNIKNFGTNSYLFDANSIKLELISPEKMYDLLKVNALGRGFAGVIFYPILGSILGVFVYLSTLAIIGGPYIQLWAIGTLFIPVIFLAAGIYLGIKSCINPTRKNHILRKKILKQTADPAKEITLKTNESFKAMFFVDKKNLQNEFPILLFDPTTKEKVLEFNILVPATQHYIQ